MLERFVFKPSEAFRLSQTRSDMNPAIEGYNMLTEMELQSAVIMEAHVLATYHGTASGSDEIVLEGMGDMLTSAVNFFKELTKKLSEFFKKAAMYMTATLVSFEKFLDKYKDKLTAVNKEYTVWGYDYSLDRKVPKTDAMSKIVSEFNSEINDISKLSKADITKRRTEFVNEGEMDRLRARIIDVGAVIEAENYQEELFKLFRSGQTDEKEIRVGSAELKSYIAQYKQTKRVLEEVRSERIKIENVYRSLENFFAKGVSKRYIGSEKKIVTAKADMVISGNTSTVSYNDTTINSSTHGNLDVINYYYAFKWKQAQTIGALSFQAYIERINAIKEAMSFYEKAIKRSIFAASEPKEEY